MLKEQTMEAQLKDLKTKHAAELQAVKDRFE